MNSTQSLCKLCFIRHKLLFRSEVLSNWSQTRHLFGFGGKKKDKSDEKDQQMTEWTVESEVEKQLTEEEVMAMRDKSRLPQSVRSRYTLKDIPPIKTLTQMRTENIRQRYATYGRASGLKPGVMWPRDEELQWLRGYEKAFCKPFHQMLDEVKAEKERQATIIRDREEEVMKSLKQLPKYKKEFWQKYTQMHDEMQEEKDKKERLIQEVREFVGYDLDPNDPRFDEALLKKDEEKKKVLKAQRKQEKQKLALERLQTLANEAMEKEKEDQEMIARSKEQMKTEK